MYQIVNHKVKTYTTGDLDPPGSMVAESLLHISTGTKAKFSSLDLDAIDPAFAPAVGNGCAGSGSEGIARCA